MKNIRRYGSAILAAIMALTLTACEEESVQSNQTPQDGIATTAATTTTRDEDEFADTDAEIKELGTDNFVPDGNSGKITWLGYYDLTTDGSSA